MRRASFRIFLLLATGALTETSLSAQEVRAEQSELLHFGFASQVGSGVYDVNGRTVQIYRIPVGVRLRSLEDNDWGLKLSFPVTIGLLDLKASDFELAELDDHLSTVSLVPGLRFEVPVRSNWQLTPFAEGGMAWDLSSNKSTWVYAAGLESLVTFVWQGLDGRLGNRLVWAGISGDQGVLSDDYGEFETGIELSHPLWFSIHHRPVDAGVFAMSYLYFEPLEAFQADGEFGTSEQWEIGVTFGTRPPYSYRKIQMPRIGLSYRFGDRLSAARLVLGVPF